DLAAALGVETVATGDAHAHDPSRVALQDVLVAIRNRTSLEGAERQRRGNRETVLLPPGAMAERFADDTGAVARTVELAARLELARECALEVRGGSAARNVLPPGRGRGSSVGSLVCYLTGLSHVDPIEADLSLGRFLNRELDAMPDIDLDFPRDIREKLIVAVTERYGREHAALVASFATYRSRGAIRDVGKALGLPFAE